MEEYMKNIKGVEKGLKIKLFCIDNSNSCRSERSWETLQTIQELCNKYFVKEVKFIEKDPKTTYAVVVYKD